MVSVVPEVLPEYLFPSKDGTPIPAFPLALSFLVISADLYI
jgi:hypothetical protein